MLGWSGPEEEQGCLDVLDKYITLHVMLFSPPIAAVNQLAPQAQACMGYFCPFILAFVINFKSPCLQLNLDCCMRLCHYELIFYLLIQVIRYQFNRDIVR